MKRTPFPNNHRPTIMLQKSPRDCQFICAHWCLLLKFHSAAVGGTGGFSSVWEYGGVFFSGLSIHKLELGTVSSNVLAMVWLQSHLIPGSIWNSLWLRWLWSLISLQALLTQHPLYTFWMEWSSHPDHVLVLSAQPSAPLCGRVL